MVGRPAVCLYDQSKLICPFSVGGKWLARLAGEHVVQPPEQGHRRCWCLRASGQGRYACSLTLASDAFSFPFLPRLLGSALWRTWGVAKALFWHIFPLDVLVFSNYSSFYDSPFCAISQFNSEGEWGGPILLTLQFALYGAQDVPPQNTATRHIEYFKQKEIEKTARAGRSLWQPPPPQLPLSPESRR